MQRPTALQLALRHDLGTNAPGLGRYPCPIVPRLPPMPATSTRFPPLNALSLFVLLGLLQSLIWIGLAFYLGSQCAWMALVLGVTAALSLRLGGMARGSARMLWAVAFTAIGVAWANWGIVVLQMGATMGVTPQESAVKLGAHLALTLLGLATAPLDYVLLALGLVVAAIAAR